MSDVIDLDTLRASIARQGVVVRDLKQNGGSMEELQKATELLKHLKISLEEATSKVSTSENEEVFNKKAFDDLMIRKMFIIPSFEIYGGVAGFYDYGPPACALKSNLLHLWREHFILEDSIHEIECTNLMPEIVLKTSGHVDKFTDLMVKDPKTGECYRADKILEDYIENYIKKHPELTTHERTQHEIIQRQAGSYTADEIHEQFQKYGITAPSGNDVPFSSPIAFNLMFQCHIGPQGNQIGYLRPETAQGIFINFRRLLEYNNGRLPFGTAQIGNAFRNEISPRGGLLRVREFQQAEIEYFVNPKDKSHPKFNQVAKNKLVLFPQDNQLTDGKCIIVTACDAVKNGIIANESLAYFLVKTNEFVRKLGIDMSRVRFRQHLRTEMSHYACDCWDLEIKMSAGWVECVGHADRSCYDLSVHGQKSKVDMAATLQYDKPIEVEVIEKNINKAKIGRTYKAQMNTIVEEINQLSECEALELESKLESSGEAMLKSKWNVTRDMLSMKKVKKTVREEKYTPGVIEPSFGVGRLVNAILEHSFFIRKDDEKRNVMSFAPTIAPIKVSILTLSTNNAFDPFVDQISHLFRKEKISMKPDTSSVTIGRKYARSDELGIPFNVTVDFDTVQTKTVTLRERDSCTQVRMPIAKLADEIHRLCEGDATWNDMCNLYSLVGENSKEVSNTIIEVTPYGSFLRPN